MKGTRARSDDRVGDGKASVTGTASSAARWALYACVAFVPLFMTNLTPIGGRPLTSDAFVLPKLVAIAALVPLSLLLWSLSLDRDAEVFLPRDWVLLAAFLLAATVSAVAGMHVRTALLGGDEYHFGLLTMLLLAGVYFLSAQLLRGVDVIRRMLWAVVAAGGLVATYALIQVAGWDAGSWPGVPLEHLHRGMSTVGNPDILGGYLVLVFPLGVGLALTEDRPSSRWAAWACAATVLAATATTQARSAWLGAAVAVTVLLWLVRRADGGLPASTTRRLAYGAAAAVGVIIMFDAVSGGSLARRFVSLFQFGGGAGSGRLVIWSETLSMIAARPLLGTGPDSFVLGWWPVRTAADVALQGFASLTQDAHDYPLMLAATVGIPAALVFLGWFGRTVWRVLARLRTGGGGPSTVLLAAVCAAVLGYAVDLLFSINSIASAAILFMLLGVLGGATARRVRPGGIPRIAVTAMLAVAAVASVAFAGRLWLADTALLRAQLAATPYEACPPADVAVRWAPWQVGYRARRAEWYGEACVAAQPTSVEDESFIIAKRAYVDLTDFSPATAQSHVAYASFLNRVAPLIGTDVLGTSVAEAEEALRLCPSSVSARVELALAYSNSGRVSDAVRVLAEWWDVDPAVSYPGVLYAELLLDQGRVDEARSVVETLQTRFPPEEPGVAALIQRIGTVRNAQ